MALCLAIALPGCVSDEAAPLPTRLPPPPRQASGLQIRLGFGAEADVDLFVTDPDLETVYFGNNPSRGGGVLERDLRCGGPEPRTEVVKLRKATPGPYRVGIEYARSCTFRARSVTYSVEARAAGLEWNAEAEIAPGEFQNRALEFELQRD